MLSDFDFTVPGLSPVMIALSTTIFPALHALNWSRSVERGISDAMRYSFVLVRKVGR